MKVAIYHSSAILRRKIYEVLLELGHEAKTFKEAPQQEGFDLLITDAPVEEVCALKERFRRIVWLGGDGSCEGVEEREKVDLFNFLPAMVEEWLSQKVIKRAKGSGHCYVLIGASTGGPGLIEQIAKSLPKEYPHPICVVQHMPNNFTNKFATRLDSVSQINVKEAEDGEILKRGTMYIAKGGKHLHFRLKDGKVATKLVPNYSNRFFVPSVDEMFLSALEVIEPKKILAVLLTGIGDDGADGMVALKRAGAETIAESEETAVVYGMPKAAKERGGACKVLPFGRIVQEIKMFGGRQCL